MQNGLVVEHYAHVGETLTKGQKVILIQINERKIIFKAPCDGRLESLVPPGHQPNPGSVLFKINTKAILNNAESASTHGKQKIKEPKSNSQSNKKHSSFSKKIGLLILTITVVGILIWNDRTPVITKTMKCTASEILNVKYDAEGNIISHHYESPENNRNWSDKLIYKVSIHDDNSAKLAYRNIADMDDFVLLCEGNNENKCKSKVTPQGASFMLFKKDLAEIEFQSGSVTKPIKSYEFDFTNNTLHRNFSGYHVLFRCTNNEAAL